MDKTVDTKIMLGNAGTTLIRDYRFSGSGIRVEGLGFRVQG